jgi:hypothetical protein
LPALPCPTVNSPLAVIGFSWKTHPFQVAALRVHPTCQSLPIPKIKLRPPAIIRLR